MLRRGILCGLALAACPASMTMALPQGGVVAGGSGSISSAGSTMNVAQQTQNLFVN